MYRPEQHTQTISGEDVVLIVLCIGESMRTNRGFIWPREGTIKTENGDIEPYRKGAGLFGWPWGIGIGEGKKAVASSNWVVFSAKPENVTRIKGSTFRCQVFPGEDGTLPSVLYYGTLAGAMSRTQAGRMAYIEELERLSGEIITTSRDEEAFVRLNEKPPLTPCPIAGSQHSDATVVCSGIYGHADVTKPRSNAVATGTKAIAVAAAFDSVAIAHGDSAIAVTEDDISSANAVGPDCIATAGGVSSIASAIGGGSATTVHSFSVAASVGKGSASRAEMYGSIAATSGHNSFAAASGRRSIAAITGEGAILEVSGDSIGVASSNTLSWRVRRRAKILVQYESETGDLETVFFDAEHLGLKDGDFAVINRGVLTILK